MNFKEAHAELTNPRDVTFANLLKIATHFFGSPRVNGTSHHVFKVPWAGKPWINLQKDGKMAKPYQVKQVIEALEKLEQQQEDKNGKPK